MPTIQRRHTCIICGCKRVERYMLVARRPRFGLLKWRCNVELLRDVVNGSNNCSKRTPLG